MERFGSLVPTEEHESKLILAEAWGWSSTVVGCWLSIDLETQSFHSVRCFTICSQEHTFLIVNHGHIAHDDSLSSEHSYETLLLILVGTKVTTLVALCVIRRETRIREDHCSITFHWMSHIIVERIVIINIIIARRPWGNKTGICTSSCNRVLNLAIGALIAIFKSADWDTTLLPDLVIE